MTCEQFREAYNRHLDGAPGKDEAPFVLAHAQVCQDCAAYRDAIASLDAELRHLPAIGIPPHLVRALEEVPRRCKPREMSVSWRPELLRALSFGIPASVVFAVLGGAPVPFQTAGDFLLAFAGLLVFLHSSLQPFFLPGPSLPGQGGRLQSGDTP